MSYFDDNEDRVIYGTRAHSGARGGGTNVDRACAIYAETGEVPLDCLFRCQRADACKARAYFGARGGGKRDISCKRCGSTDVRWRQQGGRWVLFSLTPGVVHRCPEVSATEDFK